LCGRGFRRTRGSRQKRKSDKVAPILSLLTSSYSLFTFFCLDTKESNKEKIKKRKDIQHFSFFRFDLAVVLL